MSQQGATVGWALAAARWPRATLVAGLALCSGRLLPDAVDASSSLGQRREASSAVLAARPPVFATHGAQDYTTPVDLAREGVRLAEKAGIPHEYLEFEGGHQLSRDALTHAARGLNYRRG